MTQETSKKTDAQILCFNIAENLSGRLPTLRTTPVLQSAVFCFPTAFSEGIFIEFYSIVSAIWIKSSFVSSGTCASSVYAYAPSLQLNE